MGTFSFPEASPQGEAALGSSRGARVTLAADPVPASARLVSAGPTELEFAGHRRVKAPILVVPVLLVLSLLPWLSPAPVDMVQGAVSLLCAASGLALTTLSWPHVWRVKVHPADARVVDRAGSWPLGERARWELTIRHDPHSPHPFYLASLVSPDDRRWALIGSADPSTVLRQLRAARAHCALAVESHWGLPRAAQPWSFEAPGAGPASAQTPLQIMLQLPRAGAVLRWTMALMAAVVLGELTFLVASASVGVAEVHPFSVALPALAGSGLLLLTLVIITSRARLLVGGGEVVTELATLGFRYRRARVPLSALRDVHVVEGAPSAWRHLLVDGALGPLSLPVPALQAESARQSVKAALARAAHGSRLSPQSASRG